MLERMLARRVVTDAASRTTYASVGCRLPLDGFTRSAQRDWRYCFQAESPSEQRRNSAIDWSSIGCAAARRVVQRRIRPIASHDVARERDDRRARVAAKRIGLRGPIQIPQRPGEPVEVVFGSVMVLEGDHVPPHLFRQRRNPLVELGYRLGQLLLARGMRGQFELPLHLGSRQTQRLDLPGLLRVRTLAQPDAPCGVPVLALPCARRGGTPRRRGLLRHHPYPELCNAQCSMHNAHMHRVSSLSLAVEHCALSIEP